MSHGPLEFESDSPIKKFSEHHVQLSIAISLKRIADMMEAARREAAALDARDRAGRDRQ